MLFNSLEFVLFFPIVVAIYFATPHRYRWAFLLAASYYFYGCWKAEYLILIIASTLVDYWAALQMGQYEEREKRRPFLILSLCSNLGILFAFKYFNFFNDSARAVFDQFNIFYDVPAFDVLLPVGISFYTFQTLAYTIDVYRGEKEPERHLGIFALYVSFFPQLVAGPIERSTRLLPQFKKAQFFEYQRVVDGLKLMLWGFFQKLVIADRLAIYVNEVYNNPEAFSGAPVILATYFFAFQIYCDFAGYSNIAIGAAQVMGYDLMENFRRPYFSKSISEFWRRWHISLSTWFRDYLYIPLGGNRVVKWRWYYNLFIVFLISGLWHGAAWTFVIWGALHGLYMMVGAATSDVRERLWTRAEQWLPVPQKSYQLASFIPLPNVRTVRRYTSLLITFHLVLFAWIFFRANSLPDAFTLMGQMVNFGAANSNIFGVDVMMGKQGLLIAFAAIGFMEFVHLLERKRDMRHFLTEKPTWFRWSVYYSLILAILFFGVFNEQAFIYFQF